MKGVTILLFILVSCNILIAQFSDDFSDGDFTQNPAWFGNVDFFTVEDERLRLTAPEETDEAYLTTISQAIVNATWDFSINMTFQPSSNNFANVYLLSDNSDLNTPLNGYYLEIGASNRSVRLLRQDGTSTTPIVVGPENRLASNPVNLSVRVTRDAVGFWEVYTDTLGGTDYQLEGNGFDDVVLQGEFFGVYCRFSPTRADRFYFDNFSVTGDAFIDEVPPSVTQVTAISTHEVQVKCDKNVQLSSITTLSNFEVNEGIGNPISSERNPTDASEFTLSFATPFEIGKTYTLTTENLMNFSNFSSSKEQHDFQYIEAEEAKYGDLIINEFMARSSPSIGLPDRQYVEIYNKSNKFIHLKDWQLSDRTGTGTIQDVWIYPDSIVLLVPTSGLEDYPKATNVTNWPSLNMTGDDIKLSQPDGTIIDFIQYTDEWYQDNVKSNGGYAIERINPTFNCSDATNWMASDSPTGGTPGEPNSVLDWSPDTQLPELFSVRAINASSVELIVTKGIDTSLTDFSALEISPFLGIDSVLFEGAYPSQFIYYLSENLQANTLYQLSLSSLFCCNMNENELFSTLILPDTAKIGDIVINEILHHPLTGGSDFIELYNTSSKYIDLFDWGLGNHGNDGVSNERYIPFHYILPPDDYVVITQDGSFLNVNYPFSVSGKFIELPSLPSYTNDSSTVYLLHEETLMDKVSYTKDWHFQLLQTTRGVSLERFDPLGPSNDPNNWHSASETVGFATPGRENSQANPIKTEGTLNLSSNSFSPDNDGFEDVLLLTYQLTSPELLGNINIYDDMGRSVRTLLNNELLGITGTIKWDGLNNRGDKVTIGPYIIIFEALDIQTGEQVLLRKVVTVAGRL